MKPGLPGICLRILILTWLSQPCCAQGIRINEVMSSNQKTFYDEDLSTPDWIELYNSGNEAVNLAGYGISNDVHEPYKWTFPEIRLLPGEFLILAASGKDRKTPPLFWETVISVNDTFRYMIPSTDPGAWNTKVFDDTMWTSGRSGFGYGDQDDATIVPDGTLSLLARRNFVIDDLATIKSLTLHVDFDDSFVAYLNGHEIARAHIGTPGIPPLWNMPAASSDHEAEMYREGRPDAFPCDSAIKYLEQGENLFAIEVHNDGEGSTDMSCIPYFSVGHTKRPVPSRGTPSQFTFGNTYLHVNFKISSSGDSIILTDPSGVLVDSVHTGIIPADVSLGQKPDDLLSRWFFDEPTPGAPNVSQAFPVHIFNDPVLSPSGGFITDSIELAISGSEPGDTIWYTTDGSTPKRGSGIYTGPISINESQVIKAVFSGPGRMNRKPVSSSYLLRQVKPSLTTISLSTDPTNFFDNDTGIYVLGPHASPEDPFWGANFWQDWERPVHVELYEAKGSLGLEADAGIKIFGSMSRVFPQKSLAFYARSRYGDRVFSYKMFPDLPYTEYNNFVLRNSGNDWYYTMIRDALMCSLLDQTDLDRMAYRPASVYLNGMYWGLHNIREKINEHYLVAHYNIDPYQVDLLENNGNPINGDADHYNNMISFLEHNSPEIAANYDKIKTMMDVANFMEYQIGEIYFDNYDWPGANIKFWRPRTPEGKWRWIVFDTDIGFGLYYDDGYKHNTLAVALATNGASYPNPPWSTFLLRRLLENQQFKNEFINRFADRLNTAFSYQTVLQRIDQMSNAIASEMPYHINRWNMWDGTMERWTNNVEKLRIFASNRVSYMHKFIGEQFSIPDTASLKIVTSSSQSGNIKLNTLELKSFPWEGVYFKDVPVKITAFANAGYRFVRWEGPVNDPLSSSTVVDLNGYTTVKAVFQEDESVLHKIIFNEIYYNDAPGFDADDWIELYNNGHTIADLSGWILADDDLSNLFVIPGGTILYPGDYLVLCRNVSKFNGAYPDVAQSVGDLSFGLGSSGDCLTLLTGEKVIVDAVCYSAADPWPSGPNTYGVSLELIRPEYDNSIAVNWQGSYTPHGTPGGYNSLYSPTGYPEHEQSHARKTLECSPNPFSSFTRIRFETSSREWIRLSVYDLKGNLVKILYENVSEPGIKEMLWDGHGSNESPVGPGIFICILETRNTVEHCRLVIIR